MERLALTVVGNFSGRHPPYADKDGEQGQQHGEPDERVLEASHQAHFGELKSTPVNDLQPHPPGEFHGQVRRAPLHHG